MVLAWRSGMGFLKPFVSHRMARKVGIAVGGSTVLLVGVVMIVLPGPAVLVIPLGLTILSKEFPWARRLMFWLQAQLNHRVGDARRLGGRTAGFARTLYRQTLVAVATAARSVPLVSRSRS
jgi:uncharacterized protein (TIGR02611 family)